MRRYHSIFYSKNQKKAEHFHTYKKTVYKSCAKITKSFFLGGGKSTLDYRVGVLGGPKKDFVIIPGR